MANPTIVPYSLDDYFQNTPIGSLDKAIGNNLYGINHRQIPGLVPSNKDSYGLTFFVRPQLNLQSDNVRNDRRFSPLLTDNALTIQRYVRTMLDPRLVEGYTFNTNKIPGIPSPLLDNNMAFIPILTNNLNTISGWPDLTAPTHEYSPGLYNEGYSLVDGVTRNYSTFDIDASFRNTKGDPILYMFYIWLHYSSLVFEGRFVPYVDFITENEIDYNTRIYRLVLDPQKETVRKIAACGAAFPISVPTGSFFDFNSERPYNDQNKDITIRFRCMGAEFFDDILIKEFNDTVVIFNPDMSDRYRESGMVKVSKNLISMFNNRGYPRINPQTNELEWWVYGSQFNARTSAFLRNNFIENPEVQDQQFTGD